MSEDSRLLRHFRRQRGWTRLVVEAVPEEHFDWAPGESSFSCGELVRHLIQADVFWRRLLRAAIDGTVYDPFRIDGTPGERIRAFRDPNLAASRSTRLGGTFAECLAAWDEIQPKTEALIGSLTADQLSTVPARHPLTGYEGTLFELVLVMLEHEAYHRGQLTAHMKMLDLEIPTSQWT